MDTIRSICNEVRIANSSFMTWKMMNLA
jgi:hypothetical protein